MRQKMSDLNIYIPKCLLFFSNSKKNGINKETCGMMAKFA